MLVLLGPTFEGTDEEYARLTRVTGLVAYDLRTKLKPGLWGVVRALGDPGQAEGLASELRNEGFQVAVIDTAIGQDQQRRAAAAWGIKLQDEQVVVKLHEREMAVPYAALLTVVRGEVRIGDPPTARTHSMSSSTLRAVTAGDLAAFRASGSAGQFDAFAAADLHFITVAWMARIDARNFDFSALGADIEGTAQALDDLLELLAQRASIPVDRGSHISSVASFTEGGPVRADTPPPVASQRAPGDAPGDSRFDAYSRIIAEAERQTRQFRQQRSQS